MADYKYVFLELRTDNVIEEINLYGVATQRVLGATGQFTGSFNFDQTGKNNIDLVAATTPGKTWVCVEREGTPVWWGIVWSRTYQSQAKGCQLFAWGFEAFPQRQRMLTNFARVNEANTQIFCELWTDLQNSAAGRNLGIAIPTSTSGPHKNVSILSTDQLFYSEAMDQLATAADGFDWTIDLFKDADGSYNKKLRVGYPTMGAQQGNANLLVFEYPGNILNYYMTESMSDAGTNVFAMGSGEGSTMPIAVTEQTNMIVQDNWPRWDVDVSYKDVTSQSQIATLALQESINRKPPMPTIKATIKGDLDPIVGSYNIGDACQLVITDPRNPSIDGATAGYSVPSMIVGMEIKPPASDGVEEVNIILPGDVFNG